ncbi:MAG: RdgB/HAM1 family non-canonical purine NTP pyrophosphatase [Treponema sp.]
MKIYLASGNRHKKEEFAAILPGYDIRIPADEGIVFDPEETGASFLENALLKARALYRCVRAPVIADDSGLCVDALDGKPGIYSARYGTENGIALTAAEKNRLILTQMHGIRNRTCRFVCCIAVVLEHDRFFTVQETFEGLIAESGSGEGGFGYDPIVYIPALGKTVAELTAAEKNRWSHRGKAGRAAARFLSE